MDYILKMVREIINPSKAVCMSFIDSSFFKSLILKGVGFQTAVVKGYK